MINYCIVTVREERKNNVDLISSIAGPDRHYPKICNYKLKEDREYFLHKYPEFTYELYASEPYHNFNDTRRPGEIGCWLSHVSAWDYVVKNNLKSLIVFEDDISIDKNKFNSVMKEINSTSMDMLMLGAWSSCYYITNKAARILLSHAQEGFKHHPADFYKFECIQNGLITGHMGPIILHQDPNHGSFLDFEVNE